MGPTRMETIGFGGWVAIAISLLLLIAGAILSLLRRADERRVDRASDRLNRKLKPVPIEGRRADVDEDG